MERQLTRDDILIAVFIGLIRVSKTEAGSIGWTIQDGNGNAIMTGDFTPAISCCSIREMAYIADSIYYSLESRKLLEPMPYRAACQSVLKQLDACPFIEGAEAKE